MLPVKIDSYVLTGMKGAVLMSISVNTFNNNINSTQSAMNASIKRIATGSKYNSAADNASAYSILARMYSNIDTTVQQSSNAQNTNAMLSTASGGVDSIAGSLDNIRSSLQSLLDAPTGSGEAAQLRSTIRDSVAQINDTAASTQFNGKNMLDGTQTATVANGSGGYTGVALPNLNAQTLGLTDAKGNSTLDLSSTSGIQAALDTVSQAYDKAIGTSTSIGAAQQNLSYSVANSTTTAENLTAAASTMGDTDIAAEVTKLKSSETQNAFALFASKINMHSREAALSMLQ